MTTTQIVAGITFFIFGVAAQYPVLLILEHWLVNKAAEGSGANLNQFSSTNPKPTNPFVKFVSFIGLFSVVLNWTFWIAFYLIIWWLA